MCAQSNVDVLEPHIPKGEEVREWMANDHRTIAVTDRRVIDVRQSGSENEHQTVVESTLLGEEVVGTEYRREMESKFDVAQIVVGALLGIVGVGVAFSMGTSGGEQGLIGFVIGAVFLGAGAVLLKKAEWTSNGFTSVTVVRKDGLSDKAWRFPVGETAVPQAIAQQVADLHGPV